MIHEKITAEKLFEILYEELEIPSSDINEYFNALIINIVLKKLDMQQRHYLYKYLLEGESESAVGLIRSNIPDLNNIIVYKVNELLKENG